MRDLVNEHDVPTTNDQMTESVFSTIASPCTPDIKAKFEDAKGGDTQMFTFFHALRNREEGQALVEYALILSLVSVVAILALQAVGTNVTSILNQIAAAL